MYTFIFLTDGTPLNMSVNFIIILGNFDSSRQGLQIEKMCRSLILIIYIDWAKM